MVLSYFRLRGSILHLCRRVSTGEVIMEAGKRAAARYAVDTYVKVKVKRAQSLRQICMSCDKQVVKRLHTTIFLALSYRVYIFRDDA